MLSNCRMGPKILVVLLAMTPLLNGGVKPTPWSESLPVLFGDAAVVLKGEVTSVVAIGVDQKPRTVMSAARQLFAAEIRIDRLYKGQVPGNSILILFSKPSGPVCNVSHCISMKAGDYELFFLSGVPSRFELLDQHFGKFPVSRLNAAVRLQGQRGLEADLVAGLQDASRARKLMSVRLLAAMEDTLQSTEPLVALLPADDELTNATVHAALVRLSDFRFLVEAGQILATPASDPELQMIQERISLFIEAIRARQTSPILIAFVESSSDILRRSAVHALRKMASPEAVPTFVAALRDPVQWIRYDAVAALATIESRPDLTTSIMEFQSAEMHYIQAWEDWWSEIGKDKYANVSRKPRRGLGQLD